MEPVPASIRLGGNVPANKVKKLIKVICEQGVDTDWADRFAPATAQDLLDVAEDCDGTLLLTDNEANFGRFDQIEKFCTDNGIPYDLHAEPAGGDRGGFGAYFRPGVPLITTEADADGYDVVRREELLPIRELLRVAKADRSPPGREQLFGDHARLTQWIDEAREALEIVLGPDVPPLPPFTIT
jgi:hypothetical protein